MGWTPLDDGLLTSTLLAEGPVAVAVWALILASADRYGVSKLQPTVAASLLRIPDDEARKAFEVLQGEDPDSRNEAMHGARIVKTEEGYWAIVSYAKYKKLASREQANERQRKYIERQKQAEDSKPQKNSDGNGKNVVRSSVRGVVDDSLDVEF